jgi:hypothetical protein
MAKKDGPGKRLKEAIAFYGRSRSGPPPVIDEEFKGITLCKTSFYLGCCSREWQTVCKAFEAFGYSTSNPGDWDSLIYYLADAHFGTQRGRRVSWDDDKLCRLWVDFAQIKFAKERRTDEEICKLLARDTGGKFGRRYAKMSAKTLRRLIPRARKTFGKATTEMVEIIRTACSYVTDVTWSDDLKPKIEAWVFERFAAGDPWRSMSERDFISKFARK